MTETLSNITKNELLTWCELTFDECLDLEEFEDAGSIFKLIKAIKENNDVDIEKYFYLYTEKHK